MIFRQPLHLLRKRNKHLRQQVIFKLRKMLKKSLRRAR
jgi:hypothetical protein